MNLGNIMLSEISQVTETTIYDSNYEALRIVKIIKIEIRTVVYKG